MNKVFDESSLTGLMLQRYIFYVKFLFSVPCSFLEYLVLNFIFFFILVLYLEFVFMSVRSDA